MKFDLEEEVELLPKKSVQPQEQGTSGDVAHAIEVLKNAAQEQGKSIEELIGEHDQDSQETESDSKEKEELQGDEQEESSEQEGHSLAQKSKNKALYIAQLKAKRK